MLYKKIVYFYSASHYFGFPEHVLLLLKSFERFFPKILLRPNEVVVSSRLVVGPTE